jgi:hypothetical protein
MPRVVGSRSAEISFSTIAFCRDVPIFKTAHFLMNLTGAFQQTDFVRERGTKPQQVEKKTEAGGEGRNPLQARILNVNADDENWHVYV